MGYSLLCAIWTTHRRTAWWIWLINRLQYADSIMCRLDLLLREICCVPGAQVKDVIRKLHTLVWPSDYYLLLLFHIGSGEVKVRSPRWTKRDFRASGWLVKGSGTQLFFFSLSFQLQGMMLEEIGRSTWSIPGSKTDVTNRIFEFSITSQSIWCQVGWWQTGYACLKGGKGSLHKS